MARTKFQFPLPPQHQALLGAALGHAADGRPVFPCDRTTKKPHTKNGFHDATKDPGQIEQWWRNEYPGAAIGTPTGPTSGFWILDIDPRHGGPASLAKLEEQFGALPTTMMSTTPGGGTHYFFRWRDELKVRNSESEVGQGVDVRGSGGYAILPPSVRTDGEYRWHPDCAALIDAPDWLVELTLKKPKHNGADTAQKANGYDRASGEGATAWALAALEREAAAVASAAEGTRNKTLNKAAFSLAQIVAGGGLPESEVRDRLTTAAHAVGLAADEIRRTIDSAFAAGQEHPRTKPEHERREEPPHKDRPLIFANIDAWASRAPPEREWAVLDRFPLRNVSLLSGEGSVGKSILLLQLGVAHVLGKDWLRTLPEPGAVVYLNAEDEEDELHRRLRTIAEHYGATLADLKDHLHIVPLAGQDAVLGYPDRAGQIKATPLFQRLKEAVCDIRPKMIGLDTGADIFGGNEIDRSQTRQFIGLLRQLAIAGNAGVIVCTHPSLTGINSGSGLSGSTAWHNSVRARAYLTAARTDEGDEPDPELRQIEFLKNNYGPKAERMLLRWQAGVFIPKPGAGSLERAAAEAKADTLFLDLLARFNSQGRDVNDRKGHAYAPALFAHEPESKTARLKKDALADAMRRLFAANRIRVEAYGRPSRLSYRIMRA
jgi:RecA-family ATPase